ncbi:MAG: PH domain-containing protein [Dermatophilus congolensis]|nr:PH domain-containing protein [Dermatophilus congolensis]
MDRLRQDIAEAEARMRVTFGTRTAIRDLHESLEEGETVVDMVACQFAAGDGVLVLTDKRVIALRDDFSMFRLRAVYLPDIKAVDYAPRIHDGLGVLTAEGRIAVRRMQREDADRVVDGILIRVPDAVLGVSRPSNNGARPSFEVTRPSATEAAAAEAPAEGAESAGAGAADAGATAPMLAESANATHESGVHGTSTPPPGAPSAPSDGDLAAGAEADAAVLMGVLADLHAKGLLTEDELAAKIAQLTGRG